MDSSNLDLRSRSFLFSNQVSTFSLSSKSDSKSNNTNFYQSDNFNYNQNHLNNSNRFHIFNISSPSNWRQKSSTSNATTNTPTSNSSIQSPTHWRQKYSQPHPNLSKSSYSKPSYKPLGLPPRQNFQKINNFGSFSPIPGPTHQRVPSSSDFPSISSSFPPSSNPQINQTLPYKQALQFNSHLSFKDQIDDTELIDSDLSSESSIDWEREEQIDLIPEYILAFIDSHLPFLDYDQFFHNGSLKYIDNQLINSFEENSTLQIVLLQQNFNISCPIDLSQLQFIISSHLKVLFSDPIDSECSLSDDQNFF